MKRNLKRILSSLLVIVMLVLAIPVTGVLSSAEQTTLRTIDFDKTQSVTPNWDTKENTYNVLNETTPVFYEGSSTDKYLYFRSKKKAEDKTVEARAYSGSMMFGDSFNTTDILNFTVEMTLLQNSMTMGATCRYHDKTTNQQFLSISRGSGEVYLNGASGNILLGDVSEKTLKISCVFSAVRIFNAENVCTDGYYLIDAYVNGFLVANDCKYTSGTANLFKGIRTVNGVATPGFTPTIERIGFNFGTYENSDFNAESGYLEYSFKLDDVYVSTGGINPVEEANQSTLILSAPGRTTVPDFIAATNNSNVFSAPVTTVDGQATLPVIDSVVWYGKTGEPITSVPESALSTGEWAAFTEPGTNVFPTIDFNDGTSGGLGKVSVDFLNGHAIIYGNTNKTSYDSLLVNYFPAYYKTAGGCQRVTFSVSYTMERGTEGLTLDGYESRLRTSGNDPNFQLFVLTEDGTIDFKSATVKKARLPEDGAVRVTAIVTVANTFTAAGVANGSNITVEGFVDGISYGIRTASTSKITVNTGADTDLSYMQHRLHKNSMGYDSVRQLWIDDFIFADGRYEPLAAQENPTVGVLSPKAGASVRVGEDAESSGLRFTFDVDASWYNRAKELGTVTVGALIVPTDLLGETPFTMTDLTAAGKSFMNLPTVGGWPPEPTGKTLTFNAAITNLYAHNYARAFMAIAYASVTDAEGKTTTYYSAPSDSRSVWEVSKNCFESEGYATESELVKARVTDYLGSVLALDGELAPVSITGYTSPYTASYSDSEGTLTVNGPVEGIKTVLIDGKVYQANATSGWVLNAEKTSASAAYTK